MHRSSHSGDDFEPLYARMAPMLFAWARIRIPPSMRATIDPDDIVQETWLRAVRQADRFDVERGDFRAWVVGIAHNVLLESYRRTREPMAVTNGSAQLRSEDASELDRLPASITSIRSRLANDEVVQQFFEYVDELDRDERQIILFCGFEGYTCAEAATRLALTAEATKKRWQRLRSRLRESGIASRLDLRDSD